MSETKIPDFSTESPIALYFPKHEIWVTGGSWNEIDQLIYENFEAQTLENMEEGTDYIIVKPKEEPEDGTN